MHAANNLLTRQSRRVIVTYVHECPGQIAQLVEHRTENPGVVSSILTLPIDVNIGDRKSCEPIRHHAVLYGIRRANRETKKVGGNEKSEWHPNQLRHNAATRLRREFGLDVARAVLGHSSPVVTELYAELDGAKAAEAMEKVG